MLGLVDAACREKTEPTRAHNQRFIFHWLLSATCRAVALGEGGSWRRGTLIEFCPWQGRAAARPSATFNPPFSIFAPQFVADNPQTLAHRVAQLYAVEFTKSSVG
jgi:hypothetical protein